MPLVCRLRLAFLALVPLVLAPYGGGGVAGGGFSFAPFLPGSGGARAARRHALADSLRLRVEPKRGATTGVTS